MITPTTIFDEIEPIIKGRANGLQWPIADLGGSIAKRLAIVFEPPLRAPQLNLRQSPRATIKNVGSLSERHTDLIALADSMSCADDGTMVVPSKYLEIVTTKK